MLTPTKYWLKMVKHLTEHQVLLFEAGYVLPNETKKLKQPVRKPLFQEQLVLHMRVIKHKKWIVTNI